MDWGSIAGLILAVVGIVAGQAIEGGRLSSLIQPAAFVMVIFGTLAAILLQSKFSDFLHAMRRIMVVFVMPNNDRHDLLDRINRWSIQSRRRGLMGLETFLNEETDPFIQKGLRLLIDNVPIHTIKEICSNDIYQYEVLEKRAIKIWDAAGGYAPTMGIMGAVVGLIHVMENLSDPALLGSGIAVAFVATIYGIGFANLFCLPIAAKLKAITAAEAIKRDMFLEGLACIYNKENTMLITERLTPFLPVKQ
jgi:chemotaxis protein MotA